ncbi:hypothetical protein FOZ61_009730 [Perkinsus olseni]|uniref:Pseudouridine synthase RsuA/RluA-like domain-containing protein n=1 Tax=Perkinsus olseni TaxID=32597 RepID=A0A7J6KYY0_PEROL|nr:hypothetical protein FOZ61_009730 [Perkinsus olseni]
MAERSQEAEFIRKCRERKSETKGVVRHSLGVTPIDPELMNEKLNPALSGGGGFGPMCHRLDKETSGPVLVAKTLDSWTFIRRQFHKEEVQKQYVCLVEGICARDSGAIDSPIRVRRTEKHTSAEIGSGPASSSAHSEYRVLERYEEGCTLISVKISTGVTHQIRVHMAQALNHAIVGDRKYTPPGRHLELPSVARIPDRVFLHCYELGFRADETSDRLTTIKCSLPTELRNLLWSLTPTSSCPLPADSRALLAGLMGLPTGAAAMQRWHIPYSNLLSQLNTALASGRVHRIKECNSDPAVEEEMRQNLQISPSARLSPEWFFAVHPETFKRDLKSVEGVTVRDTSEKFSLLKLQYPYGSRDLDALRAAQISWGLRREAGSIRQPEKSKTTAGSSLQSPHVCAFQGSRIRNFVRVSCKESPALGVPTRLRKSRVMRPREMDAEPRHEASPERQRPAYKRIQQDLFESYDYGTQPAQAKAKAEDAVAEVNGAISSVLPSDGTWVKLCDLIDEHRSILETFK